MRTRDEAIEPDDDERDSQRTVREVHLEIFACCPACCSFGEATAGFGGAGGGMTTDTSENWIGVPSAILRTAPVDAQARSWAAGPAGSTSEA